MIIFDGIRTAADKEHSLRAEVAALRESGTTIAIGAVVFSEDAGSQLYTRLKREAAARVGITYIPHQFSITDSLSAISAQIQTLNKDAKITGIIIQKPTKRIWQAAFDQANRHTLTAESGTFLHESPEEGSRSESNNEKKEVRDHSVDSAGFATWWNTLTAQIDPKKDVDGLHPSTLAAIAAGTWQEQGRVLPATCQAALEIMELAATVVEDSATGKVLIVGKSDLLGIPLYGVLKSQGREVELLKRKDLEERVALGQWLIDGAVVVSATGVQGLIGSEMVRDGVVLIDVGEPKADVNFNAIAAKAAFLTPVPGGVGPMTVVCLLENAVKLCKFIP
jgi:5,10-methylene-tetrahydrofolate dehydrogenase/methenyl tetrahydrofolate cyclohydrolase